MSRRRTLTGHKECELYRSLMNDVIECQKTPRDVQSDTFREMSAKNPLL